MVKPPKTAATKTTELRSSMTVTLSNRLIERSQCPKILKQQLLRDTEVPGFGIKLYPSGKKTFVIRVHSNDRSSDIKLGDAGVLSLQEARTLAVKTLKDFALGTAELPPRMESPTLDAFYIQHYLPYAKQHQRSWCTTDSSYRNHLQPSFGSTPMHAITYTDILALQSQRALTHAPSSCNRMIVLLRTMFNQAIRWKIPGVTENPTQDIELFQLNNKKERYLTHAEMQRLMNAISESPSQEHLLPIIQMLALTGARKREVLDMRWKDLDLKQQRWTIHKNKSGKTQTKPLSDAAVLLLIDLAEQKSKQSIKPQLLIQSQSQSSTGEAESDSTILSVAHAASCHATKAANDDDDWVFANPKTGKPFNTIYNSWNSARIKAGLPDVRVHDLRHNFASQLVNAGRSLYEVQKILGHADAITTQRYAHLSQERLKEAANSVKLPEVPCTNLQQHKTPAANDASIGVEKLLEIIESEKDWTAEEVAQLKALLPTSA